MTSEERERMNRLSVGIQEETDYNKFAAMLHEMSELIARKEQRRFEHHPKLVWQRNGPWKTVPAVVTKIVKPAHYSKHTLSTLVHDEHRERTSRNCFVRLTESIALVSLFIRL
jgi:hypothetical protein